MFPFSLRQKTTRSLFSMDLLLVSHKTTLLQKSNVVKAKKTKILVSLYVSFRSTLQTNFRAIVLCPRQTPTSDMFFASGEHGAARLGLRMKKIAWGLEVNRV